MLQGGGLLGGVTVRELVELMRGLAPSPLPTSKVLAMARITEVADAGRSAVRRSDPAGAVRARGGRQPAVAGARRVDRGDGRGHPARFWTAMRDWTAHGRTVLFATHYLEEADAYADRAVLLARGRVVADGPTTELKAAVGGRLARATLPEAEPERLRGWPRPSPRSTRRAPATAGCRPPRARTAPAGSDRRTADRPGRRLPR